MDILCNNGVLTKPHDTYTAVDGQGTYASPGAAVNRIYKAFDVGDGNYTISVPTAYDFIVQYKTPTDGSTPTDSGNITSWVNGYTTVTLDKGAAYGYGIALRDHVNQSGSISPSDFSGTIVVVHDDEPVKAVGTPETLWVSPNYGQTFTLSNDVPNYSGDDPHRAGTILSNLPAGKYTLKYGNVSGRALFVYYYDGGVKSSQYQTVGSGIEITLSSGGSFYLYAGAGVTVEQISTLTLEVYNTTLQTVNDVRTLLGLDDTYRDTEELVEGIKTGKVGVMVLDGTENWVTSISTKFYLDNTVMRNYNNMPVLCSHYEAVLAAGSSGVSDYQISLFASGSQGTSNARLVICDPRYTAKANFQASLAAQYAAGTPVIIVYPLATETTEQTTPHSLHTAQGTNVVSVTAEVSDISLTAEYKGVAV